MLEDDVRRIADSWWARDFACESRELRPRTTRVQAHTGELAGDDGIWILVVGGCPLISMPAEILPALHERASGWTVSTVEHPARLAGELAPTSAVEIIGPAYIGYARAASLKRPGRWVSAPAARGRPQGGRGIFELIAAPRNGSTAGATSTRSPPSARSTRREVWPRWQDTNDGWTASPTSPSSLATTVAVRATAPQPSPLAAEHSSERGTLAPIPHVEVEPTVDAPRGEARLRAVWVLGLREAQGMKSARSRCRPASVTRAGGSLTFAPR